MSWKPFRDAATRVEWRDLLLFKQNGRCALCGHRFPRDGEVNESVAIRFAVTFDHVVPRSQGGSDEVGNLRLAHYACNLVRGDGNGSKRVDSVPWVLRR